MNNEYDNKCVFFFVFTLHKTETSVRQTNEEQEQIKKCEQKYLPKRKTYKIVTELIEAFARTKNPIGFRNKDNPNAVSWFVRWYATEQPTRPTTVNSVNAKP